MSFDKLKWERVNCGFDLICLNPDQIDMKAVKKLLPKIETIHDYNKPFNENASRLWREWIKDSRRSLKEEAYCLLSNWFLSGQFAANISIRAGLALLLWHKLFCAIPERRLTSPKKNHKILKQEFDLWWSKQLKCQNDC